MSRNHQPSADFFTGPRRAVIDIGSNTVRLVIFGGSARAPTQLWNEKVTARLGRELSETGLLAQDAMRMALDGLARYTILLRGLRIDDVETVATAAVRDAANGQAFLDQVRQLGLAPRLLSGEEEAIIGAMGVLSAFPDADGVVADLGGGSMELVNIGPGGCTGAASLPLGTLRLAAMQEDGPEKFARQVAKALKKGGWAHPLGKPLYLVGGTFRSMATQKLRADAGVLDDPHGLALDKADADKLARALARSTPEELKKVSGIPSSRAPTLPRAAQLLRVLLAELEPTEVVFSSLGLREGLLYQRLDPIARMQDPLLAGVAAFAAPRGGRPSLAARIAGWTVNAAPRDGVGSERLRLASTMLAMASMQIEPNLRVPQALNWALHKRWLHLDTRGRAQIASALVANCGQSATPPELTGLASEKELAEARCWGLAIRLCRRIGANSLDSVEGTALCREEGRLQLLFSQSMAPLRNRGTEKDLANLANALELEPVVEIVPDGALRERLFAPDGLAELSGLD